MLTDVLMLKFLTPKLENCHFTMQNTVESPLSIFDVHQTVRYNAHHCHYMLAKFRKMYRLMHATVHALILMI